MHVRHPSPFSASQTPSMQMYGNGASQPRGSAVSIRVARAALNENVAEQVSPKSDVPVSSSLIVPVRTSPARASASVIVRGTPL
jgi:hypothetical protein